MKILNTKNFQQGHLSLIPSLIKVGKLKFEELDGPVGVEDPSKAKTEIRKQEKEAPKEASSRKATTPRDKVPVAKKKVKQAAQ